ncbi:SpvB/TcaC N-terminal domain-containing protein [Pseudomonas abietaniphila]|uniref:SpvB/TcaC N-terminal domain-containing protein n=1 Tax=Pseudomonas abietaniphila TaxID=89065 RepID=UPI0032166843
MADQEQTVGIAAPSLPKGGGAIQSIGKGWGAVGATGAASLEIPLPITAGRGYAPPLTLNYASSVGNGLFGPGWNLNLGCVARRATKGVPLYNDDDVILGPDGEMWLPERDGNGAVKETTISHYNDLALDAAYQVIRYFASIEGAFQRIEHWRSVDDPPGFWLVHGADGTLALYGRNPGSRSTDTADSNRVAEWLLEETMNAQGEHILYEYKAEDLEGLNPQTDPGPKRNFMAQCYLWRVRYGNASAHPHLYLWQPGQIGDLQWHFDLLFDYGERSDARDSLQYGEDTPWEGRADYHSSFAYGFELGNLRFVHYVIMFHHFPDELGPDPVLISALKLNYDDFRQCYKVLTSVEHLSWSIYGSRPIDRRPRVTFSYEDFDPQLGGFTAFDKMPGLNDEQRYQLVDLYGEGLAGVLYREDKGWLYREPVRDVDSQDPDAVAYGPWHVVPSIPTIDSRTGVHQSLADMTGNGRLDWVVAQPGMAGFFTLAPDRTWSGFAPFSAFPAEFFHPQGQLADLVGDGLSDLALIGPRSVRLYASRRAKGFAPPADVNHDEENDFLPLLSNSPAELVAFCDILGSGQQHLVRIRHNEVRFWPNMGRGHFGKGQEFATLGFAYEDFDAGRIRLADMDGSGAVDMVYLQPDGFTLFMNTSGNAFAEPVQIPWPAGVRYDRFSQVSMADLQGLGCSSLVLTIPHMTPAHWRFDCPPIKPYLLQETNNSMGASGSVTYRSSAQEWLDEKQERVAAGLPVESGVPFALHLVSRQTQLDEVTGNQLTQSFSYRQGYYDGLHRVFRGFGLILQRDSEVGSGDASAGFTAPILSKTWYHTGRYPHKAPYGFNESDEVAVVLGPDVLTSYADGQDQVIEPPVAADLREMARALAGSVLRVEVFGYEGVAPSTLPYTVQSSRYLVRQLEAVGPFQRYARMLPLALESISHQYEGQADDPMCQRAVNLAWDQYGVLTHGVTVNYARRKLPGDDSPFTDEHQQTWWRASHDEAQQRYYLSESRTEAIHLDEAQSWRLGLPYLTRANAMMTEASQVNAEDLGYEAFKDPDGWFASLPRTLVALSKQRYVECPDGQATFQALADAVEIAELDAHALTAYSKVPIFQGPEGEEALASKLVEVGYSRMASALPEDPSVVLWSVRRGFNTYAGPEHFYRVDAFRPTASHGPSTVTYDPYSLLITAVTAPDGCITSAEFSYYNLLPSKVIDPNENTQEAMYDAFGVLRMTSFYGTELGNAVGFDPLEGATLLSLKPSEAITAEHKTDYATAYYYDVFSWMRDKVPVHGITLQWDRYPDDPERQQRMTLTSLDGFGRALQTRQRVESGKAYHVVNGQLQYTNGALVEVDADDRWRVSERVEYNNKGLAVRVYRPYFTDTHEYVDDRSVREHWYHDKQFYDPLGRPTETWTAKGWLRRTTYQTWYTISEDENDTAEEVNAGRAAAGLPLLDDGSQAGKRKKNRLGF